jgi:hypothetical protein
VKININTIIKAANLLKEENNIRRNYVKILPNLSREGDLSRASSDYTIPFKEVTIRYEEGVMILDIPEDNDYMTKVYQSEVKTGEEF